MMAWLSTVLLWVVLCVAPGLVWLRFVERIPSERVSRLPLWATGSFGVVAGILATLLHRFIMGITGLDSSVTTLGSLTGILFVFAFSAPLIEGTKFAVVWPSFRSRHFKEEFDGFLFTTASATGFAIGQSALLLLSTSLSIENTVRIMMLFLIHPLLSPMWGHALGKARRSRTPRGSFLFVWTMATAVHGLFLHLAQATSLLGLVAAVPILLALGFLTWWAGRDLLRQTGRISRPSTKSLLPALPSPSLSILRHALRRTERPIVFHWIVIGAFSTTGVMLTMVVLAIVAGHRLGLDFSAIERENADATALVPLVLITSAILSAFPVSGYLVTKASGADGVLEPALSAALAIGAVLVMLGMAAPVALVFALAFAPIAFGLACIGAWFGLGK